VNLNRLAADRMVFVERTAASMVEKERALKRGGVVSEGTTGRTATTAGADFRLTGRVMSLDARRDSAGRVTKYHQIVFKMIDLESGVTVWSGIYEFKKSGSSDVIYR
ncbi:MAG: penicillin-binding protein activator LpoB, partial [Deltaproteobacteria bacterium]|nr:penicillin-binding protein activator LpoB [Deltaproteobacteria bacterium]